MRLVRRIVCIALLGLACVPGLASGAAPEIEFLAPGPIRNRDAKVNFTIDPGGLETSYKLEWGHDYSGINEGWIDAGNGPVSVSRALQVNTPPYPLRPGLKYDYRLIAANADGTTMEGGKSLVTTDGPAALGVATIWNVDSASQVSLHGTVNPSGYPVKGCAFYYLSGDDYFLPAPPWVEIYGTRGTKVPCEESEAEIGSGTEPVPVHALIEPPESQSNYLLVSTANQFDDRRGVRVVFGLPWANHAPEAIAVTSTTADLRTRAANAESYHLEYGPAFRFRTPEDSVPPDFSRESGLTAQLACLAPGTSYRFRFVFTNPLGTVTGLEGQFTTAAGSPLPTCSFESPLVESPMEVELPESISGTESQPKHRANHRKKAKRHHRRLGYRRAVSRQG